MSRSFLAQARMDSQRKNRTLSTDRSCEKVRFVTFLPRNSLGSLIGQERAMKINDVWATSLEIAEQTEV